VRHIQPLLIPKFISESDIYGWIHQCGNRIIEHERFISDSTNNALMDSDKLPGISLVVTVCLAPFVSQIAGNIHRR